MSPGAVGPDGVRPAAVNGGLPSSTGALLHAPEGWPACPTRVCRTVGGR